MRILLSIAALLCALPLTAQNNYPVYFATIPSDAKVRILNNSNPYHKGVLLKEGSYEFEISASGYETRRLKVNVDGQLRIDLRLQPKEGYSVSYEPSYTTASKSTTISGSLLLDERFDRDSGNWYYRDDDQAYLKIANGVYRFKHLRERGSWSFWHPIDTLSKSDDFSYEANLEHNSGIDNYGYGIRWGGEGYKNFYVFNITANGYYKLAHVVDDKWNTVIAWTPSPLVNKYNSKNHLKIEKKGKEVELYLNGKYLDRANVETFDRTYIGVLLDRNHDLSIHDLKVMRLGASATLIDERFENNNRGWGVRDDAQAYMRVENGVYRFKHLRASDSWTSYLKVPQLKRSDDFTYEVTVDHLSGVDDYGYGLLWGDESKPSDYVFEISPNGYYKLSRFDNGKWSTLIDWKSSSYIKKYNSKNRLKMVKEGKRLKLYVNDSYLDEASVESFERNDIGFILERRHDVSIDDLKVIKN